MITKLTKEQQALMPICRDYWISKGLQTGDTDWDCAELNIKKAYKKAKLEPPNIILRVNSPIVGALTASILNSYFNKKDVHGAVLSAVDVAVCRTVAVDDAVRDAVDDAVRDAIVRDVDDAVRDAIDDAVRDAIVRDVDFAVGDAVVRDVDFAVGDAVVRAAGADGVPIQWHSWMGGQFSIGRWFCGTAFCSFFIDYCKLQVPQDIRECFEIYKNINSSCNYFWLNAEFIIMCARPTEINIQENQLHSAKGKSIEYPDGWGLYHLYGVQFTEELFNKLIAGGVTFEDWSKEPNEEVKSAILSYFEQTHGGEFVYRFLSKHLTEVDSYVDKKNEAYINGVVDSMNIGVYTLFKGVVNDITIAYVRCYCPSTDRMFFLGVPPDFNNAKDAIASLCQVPRKLKDSLLSIARQGEIFSFNFDESGTAILKEKTLSESDFSDVVSLTGDEYFSKMKFEY